WPSHHQLRDKESSNSVTRSEFPRYVGILWARFVGSTSRILPEPVLAFPPAFSVMKASGLASKFNRYFPRGASTNSGYAKNPPFVRTCVKSPTSEPPYRKVSLRFSINSAKPRTLGVHLSLNPPIP